MIYRRPPPAL